MSYTISLDAPDDEPAPPCCPTCGRSDPPPDPSPRCPDPTYNLTGVFDLALTGGTTTAAGRARGLHLLHGRLASDTVADLDRALERMGDEELAPVFKELEPENGWGTLVGAVKVLARLRALAKEFPNRTWRVS